MQWPSYLGEIVLVSIWFRMVVIQITTQVYTYSLILTYSPNINIWLVLQIWYPRVGSLQLLINLVIYTMHSPIYSPTLVTTLHNLQSMWENKWHFELSSSLTKCWYLYLWHQADKLQTKLRIFKVNLKTFRKPFETI